MNEEGKIGQIGVDRTPSLNLSEFISWAVCCWPLCYCVLRRTSKLRIWTGDS
jgi:hypothetical protein